MKARRRQAFKGRGAVSNPAGRFESVDHEVFDDGWGSAEEEPEAPATELRADPARTVITRNRSPDIPFEASINPYRGCEHACPYCFARPSHSYLDLSPGLDFETRIFYKGNAAERLEAELRKPGYRPTPISLGINTDAYQPAERRLRVTRSLLEVLWAYRHPVSLITKSALITRDLDILGPMAEHGLVSAAVSVTSLDPDIKRRLEPRTAGPAARLRTIRALADAGVPTAVMAAPVIPAITDHELEAILAAAAEAGARGAGYVLLRLPHELKEVFRDWLETHYPDRAEHVMSLVRQSRGGKDYDAAWGTRMTGTGVFADMIAQRFRAASRRHGLDRGDRAPLTTALFRVPPRSGDQMSLL
ncbi:radical SAM domain-containing protein [Salinisphaera sp. PC39]|uniref:PA0069 family radical SAM protein n=1 Tax=Salinisphaera sp. PC39 TaxID=1304156 RepID=UPI00333EDB54